jgi:hypothetical protein
MNGARLSLFGLHRLSEELMMSSAFEEEFHLVFEFGYTFIIRIVGSRFW